MERVEKENPSEQSWGDEASDIAQFGGHFDSCLNSLRVSPSLPRREQ